MIAYLDWNRVLANHVVTGLPRGSAVYLNVDDEVLERIGQEAFGDSGTTSWESRFREVVRARVVENGRITLRHVEGHDADGIPLGVAFLAATVLAANGMGDDQEIDQADYFRRLRQVLGLSVADHGRPAGLAVGSEAALWTSWNSWLLQRGFLPTAYEGEGPKRYISYPISQSLLRRVDKDALVRIFDRNHWSSDWDAETLASRVRREERALTSHMRDILLGGGKRYEAILDAMLNLYEEWREQIAEGGYGPTSLQRGRSRVLHAGLYRTVDPFFAGVEYYIYPRQARGWLPKAVSVLDEDHAFPLVEQRPGYYAPLFPLGTATLNAGARYPVEGDETLDALVLPKRPFWILVPDPDDPESGVFISRSNPGLGTAFIVLCRDEVLRQLEELREERIVSWQGDPEPVLTGNEWVEVRGCMVVTDGISGYFEHRELLDAIRPHTSLGLGLSGGLRALIPGTWLQSAGPVLTVFGFQPTADVHITRLGQDRPVIAKGIPTGEPTVVDWPGPGDYLVDVTCGTEDTQRVVKIVSWDDIHARPPARRLSIRVGDWEIDGALIQRVGTQKVDS